MTYGDCLGYSIGTLESPLAIDEIFKFPSMTTYIVAKARLVTTIRASVGPAVDLQFGPGGSKRQCVRLPGYVGELAEDVGDKTKVTSRCLIDLENVKRFTRTKTDLALREKELHFYYRAMEVDR
jgi:hypothetical protein